MKAIAAVLAHNQPHLTWNMANQLGHKFVLVDNGSQPPLKFRLRTLRFERNLYFTGGWNVAMRRFRREGIKWVWMLNNDLEGLYPEMLSELVEIAESLGKTCAAITPAYNSPHRHLQSQPGPSPRDVPWIGWTGPLVSTEWFCKLGGFDENFYGYHCDLDLCKTLSLQGAKFYVVDWLLMHHLGGITAEAENITRHSDLIYANRVLREKWNVPEWTKLF